MFLLVLFVLFHVSGVLSDRYLFDRVVFWFAGIIDGEDGGGNIIRVFDLSFLDNRVGFDVDVFFEIIGIIVVGIKRISF